MSSTASNQSGSSGPSARVRRVRISAEESRLVRLGVVYADSLRLTITTELWMREMSPRQFFEEVGGPSLDSVRKHFDKLVEFGWLRRVRKRSSGPGRPQWVYRTTELAVIDEATWAEIPFSIRDAFTLQLQQQLSERVGLALDARSLEARPDHVFSLLSPFVLDEPGWKQGLEILDNCFRGLELEQTDAKIRLAEQGRPPILMIVALAGFESPPPGARLKSSQLLPPSTLSIDTRTPWTIRLAKVFGDPINLRIVWRLNEEALSPTQLEAAIGGASPQTFDRRCKLLMDLGWVTSLGGTNDGTRRILYRATSPAVAPEQAWAIIPERLRAGASWTTYKRLCELVFQAVKHGTLNARDDRHLTWGTLLLDEPGWGQVTSTLREGVRSLKQLEEEAKRRVTTKKEEVMTTFFVGGFESPPLESLPLWGDLGDSAQPANG